MSDKKLLEFMNFDSNTVGISFGTFASLVSVAIPLMSPNLNYVQIWEGENRPKIAYEQIVENGVFAWTRQPKGGMDPGCSWMVTFWGVAG